MDKVIIFATKYVKNEANHIFSQNVEIGNFVFFPSDEKENIYFCISKNSYINFETKEVIQVDDFEMVAVIDYHNITMSIS